MNSAELDNALSELAGNPCTHSCLLTNRMRLTLYFSIVILSGVALGLFVDNWMIRLAVVAAIAAALAPLTDRRIDGVGTDGIGQAESAAHSIRPVSLLPALRYSDVRAVGIRRGDSAVLILQGASFRGARGSRALAAWLGSRRTLRTPGTRPLARHHT